MIKSAVTFRFNKPQGEPDIEPLCICIARDNGQVLTYAPPHGKDGRGLVLTYGQIEMAVDMLYTFSLEGDVVTHGGVRYGFRSLYNGVLRAGRRSGRRFRVKQIARNHADLAFWLLCELGYYPSFDALTVGMGLQNWGQRKAQEFDLETTRYLHLVGLNDERKELVIAHAERDALILLGIAQQAEQGGVLYWHTLTQKRFSRRLPPESLPPYVREAAKLAMPKRVEYISNRDHWKRSTLAEWAQIKGVK